MTVPPEDASWAERRSNGVSLPRSPPPLFLPLVERDIALVVSWDRPVFLPELPWSWLPGLCLPGGTGRYKSPPSIQKFLKVLGLQMTALFISRQLLTLLILRRLKTPTKHSRQPPSAECGQPRIGCGNDVGRSRISGADWIKTSRYGNNTRGASWHRLFTSYPGSITRNSACTSERGV